jgi:hypothetical protein
MEANRFDELLRSMADAPSRRGIARGLTSLFLAGPLAALLGSGDTVAKKRKKKKKKCKSCTVCQQCKKGKCKPKPEGTDCGANRVCQTGACVCPTSCCSNDDCGFQGACEAGVCDCKSGARFCQDTCIPEDGCCTDEECPGGTGQTCQNGQCACPSGQKDCGGACILQDACCDRDDCDECELCQDQTCVASVCCPLCPSGQECLSNGSCATACVDQDDCTGCTGSCLFSTEGERHCSEHISSCEDFPQVCTSTTECPTGQECQVPDCGPGTPFQPRCLPLCNP